jgi:hypothetical protein
MYPIHRILVAIKDPRTKPGGRAATAKAMSHSRGTL